MRRDGRREAGLSALGAIGAQLFALASGCSGDAEKLDCAWLAGDNCYKRAVRDASACAPGNEDTGTFDASRTSCTYADGTTVAFDDPVPEEPGSEDHLWRFDVEGPDGPCVRFEETNGGFEVMGSAGNVRTVGTIGSYRIHCPDGTTYATDDPFALFECEQEDAVLPGHSSLSGIGGTVSFGLVAPEGVDGTLFRCE